MKRPAPRPYRPTTLRIGSANCPRAIDFYEAGAVRNRDIFAVGTAAHVMLQRLGEAARHFKRPLTDDDVEDISGTVGRVLIEEGRAFEGKQEPPLAADAVWQARGLVINWCARYPMEVPPRAHIELGLSVDDSWQPVEYGATARLRLISDLCWVHLEQDEDIDQRVLVVRDYKSAWPADDRLLHTVQMKAQAVLGYIAMGDGVDVIRRQICNLRTRAVYQDEIFLAHGGDELIGRWMGEIHRTMVAYDKVDEAGARPAAPGGGCLSCDYVKHCEPGRAFMFAALDNGDDTVLRGKAYAHLSALCDLTRDALRRETADGAVSIGGGKVVGTVGKVQRKAKPDAALKLWRKFESYGGDAEAFMSSLRLGAANVDAILEQVFTGTSQQDERRELTAELFQPVTRRNFGIHDTEELAQNDQTEKA